MTARAGHGPEILKKLGVEVFEINRGGKATYHGIGQLVGYPIVNLSPDREDVHKYVRDIEEVLHPDDGRFRHRSLSHRGSDRRAYG